MERREEERSGEEKRGEGTTEKEKKGGERNRQVVCQDSPMSFQISLCALFVYLASALNGSSVHELSPIETCLCTAISENTSSIFSTAETAAPTPSSFPTPAYKLA